MRIVFLGPEGTFTEDALQLLLPTAQTMGDASEFTFVSQYSQQLVVATVAQGEADFGCVPIESSVAGGITSTMDALINYPNIYIYAEVELPISFVLATKNPAAPIDSIAIYSVAEQQIIVWLEEHYPQVERVYSANNAQSAQWAASGTTTAAITTRSAALKEGLTIVSSSIADDPSASTRFILFGTKACIPRPSGQDRTALICDLPNIPGSLGAVLQELSIRTIDLIRLESRPHRTGGTKEYWFFVDFNGHIADPHVQQALVGIKSRAKNVIFCGSWPMAHAAGSKPPALTAELEWVEGFKRLLR